MGGRSVCPILGKYLVNLEKDAESRTHAMEVLKPFVKDLDSKAIPLFLAEVYQNKEANLSSIVYTISLYEVLAKFHGKNIVPKIDNVMSTIVKTLLSSAGSFPLQQACSKVVPAIARYGIEPSMPENEKSKIIYSLCKPLSDILMGPPESAASGSALCLKALVECENWGFASNDVVDEVCLKLAGALEDSQTQTNFHMALAIAVANRNSMIFEAYARSIIRSGMQMLAGGSSELNLHKRLASIQMIKFLLEYVDSRSILSEMEKITKMLERCSSDPMECVRSAAFEALRIANNICLEIVFEKDSSSITCSNSLRNSDENTKYSQVQDNSINNINRTPAPAFRELEAVDSSVDLNEKTSISSEQGSCNVPYGWSTRSLWKNENGGVDLSLKDGLLSEVQSRSNTHFRHFEDSVESDGEREKSSICSKMIPIIADTRSATPSPERSLVHDGIDNVKLFATPRRLIHSYLDHKNQNFDLFDEQIRKIRSTSSSNDGQEQCDGQEQSSDGNRGLKFDVQDDESGEESFEKDSIDPVGTCNSEKSEYLGCKENGLLSTAVRKDIAILIFGLCLILAAITLGLQTDNQRKHLERIPT